MQLHLVSALLVCFFWALCSFFWTLAFNDSALLRSGSWTL